MEAAQPAPAEPGRLRVTTSPPTPAMISIDGVDRTEWGIDWLELAAGTYEVCFGDAPSLTAPACRSVDVLSGTTVETVGVYERQATLVVSAASTGGQHLQSVISLDGTPSAHGGVSLMRDPGPVEVCWGPVADYATPACETVTLAADTTTLVSGDFVPSVGAPGPVGPFGLLRVVLGNPLPATILVDGQPTTQWAVEWVPFPHGTYEICFTEVPGWMITNTPCVSARIPTGQPGSITTTAWAYHVRRPTLRVTTSPPQDVVISVDGAPANNWGLFRTADSTQYEVCAHYPGGPVCDGVFVEGLGETEKEFTPAGPTNWSPVAEPGPDQVVTVAPSELQAMVTFDASASFDPDGTIVNYHWRDSLGTLINTTDAVVTLPFDVGVHEVGLLVRDDAGMQTLASVTVTVQPPAP